MSSRSFIFVSEKRRNIKKWNECKKIIIFFDVQFKIVCFWLVFDITDEVILWIKGEKTSVSVLGLCYLKADGILYFGLKLDDRVKRGIEQRSQITSAFESRELSFILSRVPCSAWTVLHGLIELKTSRVSGFMIYSLMMIYNIKRMRFLWSCLLLLFFWHFLYNDDEH